MSEPESTIRVSVAAPAYNEADIIAGVVREWKTCARKLELSMEFVVCDDGSTDTTWAVLDSLRRDIPELRPIALPVNRGYGAAMSAAIAACRGEYIATIDSDGQFDLADIAPMLKLCEEQGYDAVTGYRAAKADRWMAVAADHGLRHLVHLLFSAPLRDTNCALKLVRREWLQELHVAASGFPFPTEVCLRLHKKGARLAEVPVSHRDRQQGSSKLHLLRTGWHTFWFLMALRREQAQTGLDAPRDCQDSAGRTGVLNSTQDGWQRDRGQGRG